MISEPSFEAQATTPLSIKRPKSVAQKIPKKKKKNYLFSAAMTDPPRLSLLRTTGEQLKQATAIYTNNLFTFLFLSVFLFSFRSLVENGSHLLASFVDRDASLKSLLSRINFPDQKSTAMRRLHLPHHRPLRRRQFLHLTRVGTLDDDFFSGDDELERSLSNSFGRPLNDTSVILSHFDPNLGFSSEIVDNGMEILKIVQSGVAFKTTPSLDKSSDGGEVDSDDDDDDVEQDRVKEAHDLETFTDLQMFIKELEMGGRDAVALLFLVSFLSAAYGWVILGVTAIYSWVLGIVFMTVCNDLIGRLSSLVGLVWDGSRLGLKRLTGFVLMRWAVRDALTQLLGLWFFGEIEDQYLFFKLFVRLKLMPFSIMSPWIRGFEKEVSGFLFTWALLDTLMAFIFAVDAWIAIVDSRKTGREIIKEGCYLMMTMMNQAIQIKCLEAILCGSYMRWVLARMVGKLFAAIFQSAAEIYFMVAWLIFFLVARCSEASLEGRRFGWRDLEGLVERNR